jgi:hypothetical protein
MKSRFKNTLLVLGAIAAAGCDNPTTEGQPRKEPGFRVVAGADAADTVDVRPAQALTVELIGDDGKPRAGVPVQFQSTIAGSGSGARLTVRVSPMEAELFVSQFADTTDAEGRAYARVQLGTIAGPGAVVATVPALGLQVTANYTIRPGNAARLVAAPQDTILYVGRSYAVRATAQDRHGNPRTDAPALHVASGPATVGGTTVAASAFGRAVIVVQLGSAADTIGVRVVPQGTISAYTAMRVYSDELAIYTFDLDGSNLRKLTSTVVNRGYYGEMPSVWSVDGTRLFFHDNHYSHTKQLYVYDFATNTRQRLIDPAGQLEHESWPVRSFDGQWVYFTGGVWPDDAFIYRVRTDGSGRERVGNGRDAALSPDGTRLAYVISGMDSSTLVIRTLSTGARITIPGDAVSPRWSPSGEEIAYLSVTENYIPAGALRVVKPDGTGDRPLVASGAVYRAPFDYSPDGKYIIAATRAAVPTVIEVATGREVPVSLPGLSHGLLAPSWKP